MPPYLTYSFMLWSRGAYEDVDSNFVSLKFPLVSFEFIFDNREFVLVLDFLPLRTLYITLFKLSRLCFLWGDFLV